MASWEKFWKLKSQARRKYREKEMEIKQIKFVRDTPDFIDSEFLF